MFGILGGALGVLALLGVEVALAGGRAEEPKVEASALGAAAARPSRARAAAGIEASPLAADAPEGSDSELSKPEPEPEPEPEWLRAPSFEAQALALRPEAAVDREDPEASLYASAYQYDARIFSAPSAQARLRGIVRRGHRIEASRKATAARSGCPGGEWFEVEGGYVCSSDGFAISRSPDSEHYQKRARTEDPLPFRYGLIANAGAPRFHRLPSAPELLALAADPENAPDVVQRRMVGDYFVALDRLEEGEGGRYWRTVRGHYVRESDVQLQSTPSMTGEALTERGLEGGLAFVFGEERPLYRVVDAEIVETGRAEKYARFYVDRLLERGEERWVVDAQGRALRREHVRIARSRERPASIPAGVHWIHVDFDEQTLVAYEGARPVFATLVASGKEGYDTPSGIFRIQNKHISITMQGSDPIDGRYEVEEVPWSMFYYEGFALHGAYWHDDFGKVRSHGCTNLAPVDARWLYYWTTPGTPAGWHAVRARLGTWLALTRRAAPPEEPG
ncbi:MAG: L,D-transpeptidase [Myxococcales bacterium]|nr:L,D-transpeptidase [Myxococcales bacterium]